MEPVLTFQNLMHRSAVPPPDASNEFCHGHQDTAFTADWRPKKVFFFQDEIFPPFPLHSVIEVNYNRFTPAIFFVIV